MNINAKVEQLASLSPLCTPNFPDSFVFYRAQYKRTIPAHYFGNPFTRSEIDINLLLTHGAALYIPSRPQTSFVEFYRALQRAKVPAFRRILSPSGTAKTASSSHLTPIKEIVKMSQAGFHYPAMKNSTAGLRCRKKARVVM